MNQTTKTGAPPGYAPNVRLAYCYRCLTGPDCFGEVILPNQYALTLRHLKDLTSVLLYDGIYFDADLCGLPRLTGAPSPDWHEVTHLGFTPQPCSTPLDVTDFLANALRHQCPRPGPTDHILDYQIAY